MIIFQNIPKNATHSFYEIWSQIDKPKFGVNSENHYPLSTLESADYHIFLFSYFVLKHLDDQKRIKNLDLEKRKQLKFLHSYSMFGLHEIFDQECKYFVMIRDPIDRALSLYHWIKEKWPEEHILRKECQELSFIDWHCKNIPPNFQTILVSGLWYETAIAKDKAALTKAIENIEKHYLCALPLDRFDQGLSILENDTGLSFSRPERKHVNKRRLFADSLTSAEIKKLNERESLDLALFEYVYNYSRI